MIIVTRQEEYSAGGCHVVNTLREAFALAENEPEEEVFIAGGSEIYYQTIDMVEKVYLTRVHAIVDADSYFPEVSEPDWNLVSEKRGGHAIPYSEILNYAERSGLDSSMIDVLVTVTRHLEETFYRWQKGERDRRALADKPSPAQRGKRVSKRG